MVRRRILRPDEADLWQAVTRTARPMHSNGQSVLHRNDKPQEPSKLTDKVQTTVPLAVFRLGEKATSTPSPRFSTATTKALDNPPLQMDSKAFDRMTRGKLAPEARIDLHGLTLAEAHPELTRFVLAKYTQGLRLILVITGKGKAKPDHGPIPSRIGALRHQVPQWLRLPPLAPLVLQVTEAHLRHGGAGAYYVYLRRGR